MIMDKQTFLSYLQYYKDFESAIRRVEKAFGGYRNVELFDTDWYQSVDKMFSTFLECYFTEKGLDLIYDKLFDPFADEYNLRTGEELWEELTSNREFYFNE